MKGKGARIENDRADANTTRCGHNYEMAGCPFKFCAARSLLEAAIRCDRQHMEAYIGHDAIVAMRAAIRLAGHKPVNFSLAKARGETPDAK
jgi:hypothetical protein